MSAGNVRNIRAEATALITRKPTGKPPWPIVLLAGAEKAGKSYSAAQASASALVGRTLWVGVGENDPDELGSLPGARFEIVEHDGTYRGILRACQQVAALPRVSGKPVLFVFDSVTRLWDLLCDEAQLTANKRAAAKAAKFGRTVSEDDVQITMDLWNTAKQRWAHVIDALREHNGPVLVTARLEETTIMDAAGNPTKDKTWKVKAEKSLPFDVDAIVQMPTRGEAWLTGVRSLRFKPDPKHPERTGYPDFTVEKFWTDLGLAEKDATSDRVHSAIDAEDKPAAEADVARSELLAVVNEKQWDALTIAVEYASQSDGTAIRDATSAPAIRAFTAWLLDGNWPPKQANG